ncbi:MAG: DUF6569 family protein [Syntrophomonadaceae bacterium]
MNTIMNDYFQNIRGGETQQKHNLQLIPLFHKVGPGERGYLLLDEALEREALQLQEATEQGMVNNLIVINLGRQPVLILDGEELIGAKQNRMVNATILIPPESRIDIPVSCVERGRWNYNSQRFSRSDAHGYSELRKRKAEGVTRNLARNMSFASEQHEVWAEIDRKQAAMNVDSHTDAMHDVYRKYEKELDEFIAGLRPQENQSGLAVFISGRFNCLDLFGHPDVLGKLWDKLLKSYAMEALEQKKARAPKPKEVGIGPLLASLQGAELNQYPSVGLGTDVRLLSPEYMSAGLIYEEMVLHLAAFPRDDRDQQPHPRNNSGNLAQPSRRRRTH